MNPNKPKSTFDLAVFRVLKYTVAVFILMCTISWFASFSAVWNLSLLAFGILTSAVIIILKGARTGKRYAQGARTRRAKWLPIFGKQDQSLADDVFRVWKIR